jgi:N6-L-threonylcarbamoyladenine synthase
MIVLGIETSCDDTSIALIEGEPGQSTSRPKVLAHRFFSQELILRRFGGVVPEIAARNHLAKLTPLLEEVFHIAQLQPSQIDLIGVTSHPGLLGPLLTGLNAAKSLALFHEKPILPVNHLHAHLEAIFLTQEVSYPFLGMLVSGGHSLYALVSGPGDVRLLGSTIDDAAGEAFDKGGKLMGLGYPAGAVIDRLAVAGNPKAYSLPVGLKNSKDAKLSFSGLKTSLRTMIDRDAEFIYTQNHDQVMEKASQKIKDLCASYQAAIIEALLLKLHFATLEALHLTELEDLPLVVGGGVAANKGLRTALEEHYKNLHLVAPEYCTDNGAMIANFALRRHQYALKYPECLVIDPKGKALESRGSL